MTNNTENAPHQPCQNLCLVLGDQLTLKSELWKSFDIKHDRVLMAEVFDESVQTASSKMRTWLFLSAMRHFAQILQEQNYPIEYYALDKQISDFSSALELAIKTYRPQKIRCVLAGDERVRQMLNQTAKLHRIEIEWLADSHFIAEPGEFSKWMANKKKPRMEYWYRYLRKRHNILMDEDAQPIGGAWNFDKDNRKTFGKTGPGQVNQAIQNCKTDDYCQAIINQVKQDIIEYLPELPGEWGIFMWPINRQQASTALSNFIENRLAYFGDYQDAMWMGEDWLHHSLLSSSLNLKLLTPREVIKAAEQAYHRGKAPINAVEGFIRQILGWREFIRGLYWHHKEQWGNTNALNAQNDLPEFYWHGQTKMRCLNESLRPVLNQGYGHHIQRLMVTGLFALLWQVKPQKVHEWYLAMYIDAVAWVEVPNTIGMGQYADGGIVGSKPYIASGAYINRMSNYCKHCPYSPTEATGDTACPFTTLYWNFVKQNEALLQQNPRLNMQVKNWHNKTTEQKILIEKREIWLRNNIETI